MRVLVSSKENSVTADVPNEETRSAMMEADELARQYGTRFTSADELLYGLESKSKSFSR